MERTNAHESEGNGGRRKKGDEGRKQKHMKSKSDELGGAAAHAYYTPTTLTAGSSALSGR